jgi:tetratricopeptide (TPR) repeat protein
VDLLVASGSDRRAAQFAATLEQIYRERNDTANAGRFAELLSKFQTAADSTSEPASAVPQVRAFEPASMGAVPVDMAVERPTAVEEFEISPDQPVEEMRQSTPAIAAGEEVDLSDEWEAMVQEVADPASPPVVEASTLPSAEPLVAALEAAETVQSESSYAPAAPESLHAEPEVYEIREETGQQPDAAGVFDLNEELAAEPSVPNEAAADGADFELELTPTTAEASEPFTTEDFISELALEVDGMEPIAPVNGDISHDFRNEPQLTATAQSSETGAGPSAEATEENLNQLSEVFQEFRNELGELGEEDEDLETHYNLGIAYREMGLLEEAIGEFQKVAKAVQKGKPFRYSMNCAVLLALSFGDKGEHKIAALWYKRALDVPGLDQDTVLALRYDLGISLELAGDSDQALDCFRQVYAMNIDYRDVSDRIATLQHH